MPRVPDPKRASIARPATVGGEPGAAVGTASAAASAAVEETVTEYNLGNGERAATTEGAARETAKATPPPQAGLAAKEQGDAPLASAGEIVGVAAAATTGRGRRGNAGQKGAAAPKRGKVGGVPSEQQREASSVPNKTVIDPNVS